MRTDAKIATLSGSHDTQLMCCTTTASRGAAWVRQCNPDVLSESLRQSLEVFNNDTGETTVFMGGGKLESSQPEVAEGQTRNAAIGRLPRQSVHWCS